MWVVEGKGSTQLTLSAPPVAPPPPLTPHPSPLTGLNDTKARSSPHLITSSENVPKFASLLATQNYSIALSTTSELYTFGCNSNYQLGLNDQVHRSVPTFVDSLRAKQISKFASSGSDTFAFTPSSIFELDPPCGPISGGSKLFLRGGGSGRATTLRLDLFRRQL